MDLSQKQTNYHFESSILINNSQQKVWSLLTNVSKWSEWDTEIERANLLEKFSVGAKGVLTPQKGPKLKFYISEMKQNESYTFITKMPIGTLEVKRTLEKKGNQIEFRDNVKFTGFLRRLFGLMLGDNFKLVLPQVLQNFKDLAEKE